MQSLRGYKLNNPKNYDHGFLRELAERFGFKVPPNVVGLLVLGTAALVVVQYL